MSVLDAIGNTSLVRLRRFAPANGAELWVKLEGENPTGSMKDRMAAAVISRAEADGRLAPGGTVVEYTGGSTGTSLAFVCAAKGYRARIVTSDAFSPEKRDHMPAVGAGLTLVPSEGGPTTKRLILDMVEAARALSREPASRSRTSSRTPTPSRAAAPSARRSCRGSGASTRSSTPSALRPRSAASRAS